MQPYTTRAMALVPELSNKIEDLDQQVTTSIQESNAEASYWKDLFLYGGVAALCFGIVTALVIIKRISKTLNTHISALSRGASEVSMSIDQASAASQSLAKDALSQREAVDRSDEALSNMVSTAMRSMETIRSGADSVQALEGKHQCEP